LLSSCAVSNTDAMRVMDTPVGRPFSASAMISFRDLITFLCVVSLVVSAVFMIRPVSTVAGALRMQEALLTATQSAGSKKPCERAGLSRFGTTCSSVVFVDPALDVFGVLERSTSEVDLVPQLRVAIVAQWLSGSPFRPPRDQA